MYAQMANQKISDLPYNKLNIKLKDPKNREHIKRLKRAIQKRFEDEGYPDHRYRFRDVIAELEDLENVQFILKVIFAFIIAITMFLCFFSLSASMGANLYTQAKEIGVMRAIGVSKFYIVRIYVYEAFILVFSSAF
jgi:ABC-type antimicrobial peptide transport system permease subunit